MRHNITVEFWIGCVIDGDYNKRPISIKWTLNRNIMIKATPCGNAYEYADKFTLSLILSLSHTSVHSVNVVTLLWDFFRSCSHVFSTAWCLSNVYSNTNVFNSIVWHRILPIELHYTRATKTRVPSIQKEKKNESKQSVLVARESSRMNALSFFLPFTHLLFLSFLSHTHTRPNKWFALNLMVIIVYAPRNQTLWAAYNY